MSSSFRTVAAFLMLSLAIPCAAKPIQQTRAEKEREKAVFRQQFSKSFHDLQVISQQMLKEHEGKQLTSAKLSKAAKLINKAAKSLRTLMALGELAQEPYEINEHIVSSVEFDQSIQRLAKIIYDFSHSPHHKNTKVFDTVEAAKVQKELLTIIALSKVIESQANQYSN